jgi:hypothetical protein
MAGSALLDLSTLLERDHITIDGAAYELRLTQELSVMDGAAAARLGEELQAVAGKSFSELTEDEAAKVEAALRWLIATILIAPPEVQDRLQSQQRLAIAMAFFQRRLGSTRTTRAATTRRPTPSTGARSSRGSSGSTAGRRRTG